MDVVYAQYDAQVTTPDGGRFMVRLGQYWPPDDPVVRAAPEGLFSPDPRPGVSCSVPPVEQATAAPGEKRSAVRRG